MLRYFETIIVPTARETPGDPPEGLLNFYWFFVRQAKGLFIALLLASLLDWHLDTFLAAVARIECVDGPGAAEQQRAQRLAAAIPGAVLAPKMNLREAAALLGHAAAVIGVDTGLTHLANALDVPLVAIYTDTDPALTGVVETARAANIGRAGEIPAVDVVLALLARVRGA